jgi:hypothetical protein
MHLLRLSRILTDYICTTRIGAMKNLYFTYVFLPAITETITPC